MTSLKKMYEQELNFNSNNYQKMCETSQEKEGRCVLVHFVIKIKKYQAANLFLKDIYKILNEYYDKEKNQMLLKLNDVKNNTKYLVEEITKLTELESANLL